MVIMKTSYGSSTIPIKFRHPFRRRAIPPMRARRRAIPPIHPRRQAIPPTRALPRAIPPTRALRRTIRCIRPHRRTILATTLAAVRRGVSLSVVRGVRRKRRRRRRGGATAVGDESTAGTIITSMENQSHQVTQVRTTYRTTVPIQKKRQRSSLLFGGTDFIQFFAALVSYSILYSDELKKRKNYTRFEERELH